MFPALNGATGCASHVTVRNEPLDIIHSPESGNGTQAPLVESSVLVDDGEPLISKSSPKLSAELLRENEKDVANEPSTVGTVQGAFKTPTLEIPVIKVDSIQSDDVTASSSFMGIQSDEKRRESSFLSPKLEPVTLQIVQDSPPQYRADGQHVHMALGTEPIKRRRGRPKGSKNRKLSLTAALAATAYNGSPSRQRRASDSRLEGRSRSAKKAKYEFDSLMNDLIGPQTLGGSGLTASALTSILSLSPYGYTTHGSQHDSNGSVLAAEWRPSSMQQHDMHRVSRTIHPSNKVTECSSVMPSLRQSNPWDSMNMHESQPSHTYYGPRGGMSLPIVVPGSASPRSSLCSPTTPYSLGQPQSAVMSPTGLMDDLGSSFLMSAGDFTQAVANPFYPKISQFERCVLCGESGQDHSTAMVCSRRSCQRLFCTKCIGLSNSKPGVAVFNEHVHECIVCVYQSRKRTLSDPNQWHFEFRDDNDGQFVRMLRDMLPLANGLFIEISKTRQPCWRRKLRNGARKHFSFRFYGGIFESRLEALEISRSNPCVQQLHALPEQNVPTYPLISSPNYATGEDYVIADGVPFNDQADYAAATLGRVGMGFIPQYPDSTGSKLGDIQYNCFENDSGVRKLVRLEGNLGTSTEGETCDTINDPVNCSFSRTISTATRRYEASSSDNNSLFLNYTSVATEHRSRANSDDSSSHHGHSWANPTSPSGSQTGGEAINCNPNNESGADSIQTRRPSYSVELVGDPVVSPAQSPPLLHLGQQAPVEQTDLGSGVPRSGNVANVSNNSSPYRDVIRSQQHLQRFPHQEPIHIQQCHPITAAAVYGDNSKHYDSSYVIHHQPVNLTGSDYSQPSVLYHPSSPHNMTVLSTNSNIQHSENHPQLRIVRSSEPPLTGNTDSNRTDDSLTYPGFGRDSPIKLESSIFLSHENDAFDVLGIAHNNRSLGMRDFGDTQTTGADNNSNLLDHGCLVNSMNFSYYP